MAQFNCTNCNEHIENTSSQVHGDRNPLRDHSPSKEARDPFRRSSEWDAYPSYGNITFNMATMATPKTRKFETVFEILGFSDNLAIELVAKEAIKAILSCNNWTVGQLASLLADTESCEDIQEVEPLDDHLELEAASETTRLKKKLCRTVITPKNGTTSNNNNDKEVPRGKKRPATEEAEMEKKKVKYCHN